MTIPFGLLAPGEHGDYGQQPSAITSLLQQMAGPQITPSGPAPINAPPPQAAPLPPQAPAERPHMLHRIAGLLGSIGSSVGSSLLDTAKSIGTTPTPAGYEGLLTPAEIQGEKSGRLHNILSALSGVDPQAEYQNSLNNVVKLHGAAQQVAEQKRLDAVRANMATMFTPKPGDTIEQQRDNVEKMYSYAILHGDLQTAKLLETAATESIKRPKTFAALHEVPGVGLVDASDVNNPRVIVPVDPTQKNKQIVNAQEGVFELRGDGLYDAATGQKYTGKTVHPVALAPAYSPVTIAGENGAPPVVVPFNTKAGTAGAPIGEAKPSGIAGRSTASIMKALANNQQQLAVIDDALKELDAYPNATGLKRGLPFIGDKLDQRVDPQGVAARASIANIGSLQIHDRTGAAMTAREEPRLAPFVPNVGDTPEAIRTKLKKLKASIGVETDYLAKGVNAPSSAGASTAASPLRAKYDAAAAHLKAQGKTDAQIKSLIGDPP